MNDPLDNLPDPDREFFAFHDRNLATALGVQGLRVDVFGGGTVGAEAARNVARNGFNVVVYDFDVVEPANRPRMGLPRDSEGVPKVVALEAQMRAELPAAQQVHGVHVNLLHLSHNELRMLVRGSSCVVAATGSPELDRRVDAACRREAVPVVIPGLWPRSPQILGELFVSPYGIPLPRQMACATCVNPVDRDPRRALEAQPGRASEIAPLVAATVEAVLALLLPDTPEGQRLRAFLAQRQSLFLVGRFLNSSLAVLAPPDPVCAACGTPGRARERQPRVTLRLMARMASPQKVACGLVTTVMLPLLLIVIGLKAPDWEYMAMGATLCAWGVWSAAQTRGWTEFAGATELGQNNGFTIVGIGYLTSMAVLLAIALAFMAVWAVVRLLEAFLTRR